LRNGECHGCLPSRSKQDNLGRHAPADRVVVEKPGDEVANSGPPEQLDLAAHLFAADADVALADHADVAQQPIVELGQRVALPGSVAAPADAAPPYRQPLDRWLTRGNGSLLGRDFSRKALRPVVFMSNNIDVSFPEFNMKHMYHIMRNSMAGARNYALRPGYGVPYLHGSGTGYGSSPAIGSMKNVTKL